MQGLVATIIKLLRTKSHHFNQAALVEGHYDTKIVGLASINTLLYHI